MYKADSKIIKAFFFIYTMETFLTDTLNEAEKKKDESNNLFPYSDWYFSQIPDIRIRKTATQITEIKILTLRLIQSGLRFLIVYNNVIFIFFSIADFWCFIKVIFNED